MATPSADWLFIEDIQDDQVRMLWVPLMKTPTREWDVMNIVPCLVGFPIPNEEDEAQRDVDLGEKFWLNAE